MNPSSSSWRGPVRAIPATVIITTTALISLPSLCPQITDSLATYWHPTLFLSTVNMFTSELSSQLLTTRRPATNWLPGTWDPRPGRAAPPRTGQLISPPGQQRIRMHPGGVGQNDMACIVREWCFAGDYQCYWQWWRLLFPAFGDMAGDNRGEYIRIFF